MADLPSREERALRELGSRFRAGFAKKHPISNQSLDTVRKAVREQYRKEMAAKQKPTVSPPNTVKENPVQEDGLAESESD